MNFVEELRWRGMLQDMMPGTEELLAKEQVTAYLGIDPTADSLHIGHLCGVMMLRHLQRVLDDQQLDIRPIVVFLRYAVDHDFLHNGPMIPPTPYFAPPPSPRYSSSMFIRAISAPPLQHKHIPQRRTKVQRKNNNTLALILSMTI